MACQSLDISLSPKQLTINKNFLLLLHLCKGSSSWEWSGAEAKCSTGVSPSSVKYHHSWLPPSSLSQIYAAQKSEWFVAAKLCELTAADKGRVVSSHSTCLCRCHHPSVSGKHGSPGGKPKTGKNEDCHHGQAASHLVSIKFDLIQFYGFGINLVKSTLK